MVQARPELFLETLVGALTTTGHMVRASTPDAGVTPDLVARHAPDLCLLHDAEPTSCLAAARMLRSRSPGTKLVVISTGSSPQTKRAYDEFVVDAVVFQTCAFTVLGSMLHRVARGERCFAERALPPIVDVRPSLALTPRERQVLEHLVRGASTRVIATELAISPHTVRSHVQGLMRKLDAHGRAKAVTTALSRSLVESGVA